MGGIFICYRRDDAAGQVGRLFGRLAAHYGEDFVFMDVESINPSEQFETVVRNRIKLSDVVLVAIGPRWTAARDVAPGTKDYVRMEIAAALAAGRPLCPAMIDRDEDLDPATLPEEYRPLLESNACEIRHRTFDRDVDALIAGLQKLGVCPPAGLRRRRLEAAMLAADWPFSWLGTITRAIGPAGAVAMLAAIAAAAGLAAYLLAFNRGKVAGDAAARAESALLVEGVTQKYEQVHAQERRSSLRISGLVTDGRQGVEDAEITLTNLSNNRPVSSRTDSRGIYVVDLATIEIGEDDVVLVEVKKPGYKPLIENVKYYEGFREFRAVLRK